METNERNKRVLDLLRHKVNYMMKSTLTDIEIQTRRHEIKNGFFDRDTKSGFYAIRKTLFNHGNNIITLLELLLNEVELQPKRGYIDIPESVIKECKK